MTRSNTKMLCIPYMEHLSLRIRQKYIFADGPYMGWPLVPIWTPPGIKNCVLHSGDIHGMAPGAKMAVPWGPRLISTFRGHMDLYHHVSEKNLISFNIGHLTCWIWPIFQFSLRGSCSMDRDAYAYISEHPPGGLRDGPIIQTDFSILTP